MLSPIVVFCYRRSIKRLMESLIKNKEYSESPLYIFSDGSKGKYDSCDVKIVRDELKDISLRRDVNIDLSDNNKGLSKSIIEGVSKIIEKYGKIIVLEDDLVVSKYFLRYMNEGLNFHEQDPLIWSISGYSPKLESLKSHKNDTYLSVRSSSWGWGTWADRWSKIDWNISDFEQFKKNQKKINKFNRGGDDMFKLLELQWLGKIDSWAIRWCYSQFKNNSYSVFPIISTVENLGFEDNLGTHNSGNDKKWIVELNKRPIKIDIIKPEPEILDSFQKYHNLTTYTKIGYFLKKNGGYNLVKKIIRK